MMRQGWAGGLGGLWFCQYQGALLQLWRCSSATTAHRALPVCEWPALGMSWATTRSNTASAVWSRRVRSCTWLCVRAVQVVVCVGYSFPRTREFSSCRGSAWQPQCTEPCQCANGQPWAYHGLLQGQMEPLQCAAGLSDPVLGCVAGLGRWFVEVVVLPVPGSFQVVEALLSNHSAQSPASV